MTLISARTHKDEKSAAFSVTENRISKIERLRLDDDCRDLAVRNADSLVFDVLEFLADGRALTWPQRDVQELANMAIVARDRCRTDDERESHNLTHPNMTKRIARTPQVKPAVLLELTPDQVTLCAEGLDSHVYWQLSDESRRRDGYVDEPHTEEEREALDLEQFLRDALPKAAVTADA